MIDPKDCVSTHGRSGWMPGSLYDRESGKVTCGMCGTEDEPPVHDMQIPVRYRIWENPRKWWRREIKEIHHHKKMMIPGNPQYWLEIQEV